MKAEDRFKALAAELEAQKDRVRHLMMTAHGPTDGEWMESVLRGVLDRHLPRRVVAGSGFIVNGEEQSSQIDILIYDTEAPLLHRDGDVVFVTPDAVRGIVEVKATARRQEMTTAFEKLARNARIAATVPEGYYREPPFVGLFAYGVDTGERTPEWALEELRTGQSRESGPPVGYVCLGSSFFIHYWSSEPGVWGAIEPYERWHLYSMPRLAPGYFVANVVERLAAQSVRQNRTIWYPEQSKEVYKVAERARAPYVDRAV